MGYRGSKSNVLGFVKEQRVNGSLYICSTYLNCTSLIHLRCTSLIHLRYTLTGFERNFLIKIPSKQINKGKLYSTVPIQLPFKPDLSMAHFITGFIDAEGCFSIVI